MGVLNSMYLGRAAVVLFCAGCLALLFTFIVDADSSRVNAASALLIVGAAFFAAAMRFHSEERDRAFKLLGENPKAQEILDTLNYVGRVITLNGRFNTKSATQVYISPDKGDREFVRKLFLASNFFEEIAIGVKYRQINEDISREFYAGMFCRCYVATSAFYPVIRNYPERIEKHPFGQAVRPGIFTNVDWLYDRWRPYYDAQFTYDEAQATAARE